MHSNLHIPRRVYPLFALIGLLLGAMIFYTIYQNLTTGSTDFYPRWKAAELFFKEGVNPYDDRIGEESQQAIYGRLARPGEDRLLYSYPHYVIFMIAPLGLLEYQLAAAIFMTLLLTGILLSLGLQLVILRWLPSPLMLALLILFAITSYLSVRGILLAQPVLVAYVMHILALWGMLRGHEYTAGTALALSTIKPQTGYLVVPLLFLWAWRNQQRGVVGSFIVVFGGLCGISFLFQPTWLFDWLDQINAYADTTSTIATVQIITQAVESIPDGIQTAAQIIISLLLAVPVLIFWKQALLDKQPNEFLWGYCLTMTYSLTVAPRVATTYYVEMYFVLVVVTMILCQQRRTGWVYLAGVVLILGYWALHIATVPPVNESSEAGKEARIVYLVFPLLIWILLFVFRQGFPQYNNLITRIAHEE
jgi:hypothetical protein